jgi:hypothetical protein
VAKEYFPDEILDYDPLSITATDVSAFEAYMRDNNVTPRVHSTSGATQSTAAVQDNLPLR